MKDEDRQKVNYVKAELNNYYHFKKRVIQLNFEACDLQARIDKISGGSPALIPSGEREHNPHWRSPLFDELEYVENKIDNYVFRYKQVEGFLNRLQPNDREIIWRLHVSENDKKTYSDYCFEVYMDRVTLHRYVARLILRYWQ